MEEQALERVAGEWFGMAHKPRCGWGVRNCSCGPDSNCKCGGHNELAHGWHYPHCPLYGLEGYKVKPI